MLSSSVFSVASSLPPILDTPSLSLQTRADNAAEIQQSLQKLTSENEQLDQTLKTIPDNATSIPPTTELELYNEFTGIGKTGKTLVTEINQSSNFTAQESQAIIADVQQLEAGLFITLKSIVAHKQAAENVGVAEQIEEQLKSGRKDVLQLHKGLQARVTKRYAKEIPAIEKAVNVHFIQAIKAYAS